MAVTRIKNNQITDASGANTQLGVNAAVKLQNYSVTAGKLANSLVYGSDLTVSGNLTVNGTTTTVDTINTLIKDPILTLADGQTSGTPVVDIGLLGLRGSQNSSFMGWQETGNTFMAILSNTISSNTTVNVTSYANFTASTITAQGNLSVVGNIVGTANFTGNLTAGNILTPGLISATGNLRGGNINTVGLISATGNVYGGNSIIAGTESVTGTITGGNVLTAGLVSATGNVTGGNILTAGLISSTGNITGGNLSVGAGNISSGNISATGNITAANFIGNISGNIDAAGANTQIQFNTAGDILGANANFTYNYATNVMTVNGGNIATGNLSATGAVVATANVTGGNLLTAGITSSTGNITTAGALNGATLSLSGNVTSALNVTGNTASGNLLTPGIVSATGNVTGGNIIAVSLVQGANVSATANVTGGNILTAGFVSAAGNITTATNLNTPNVVATANLTLSTSGSGNILLSPTTGNIVVNSKNINGVADPVQSQDVATKIYVDNMVSTQLAYHQAVVAATVSNLATATGGTITYNNGANGVGANITTTGSFNLIDTANVQTANTRILVKNEANAALNGVYQWSNATVITRTTDADTYGPNSTTDLSINDYFFVQSGNVNKGSAYIVDAPAGVITFGTSNITFAQFSSSQTYSGGNGISLYGTVISTVYDNSTIGVNGSNQLYIPANAPLTTPNIGAATGTSLSVTGTVTATTLSSTGNTIAGNVTTVGLVSATGNVTGGNVLTAGIVSSTGNVTGGNVLTVGLVSATGNVTGGNLLTSGLISATSTITSAANITGGNILTAGIMSSTGNAIAGNVLTAGLVSATGNGIFGNVNTVIVNATGNINTSANINQTGTGNINGYNGYFSNNLTVIGTLQTTSNIVSNTSGIFYGNSVTGNGAIYGGVPGFTPLASNVVIQFAGNVNSYSQVNFENINNGTRASTDYIATADNGTDSTYYLDMGIASSAHTDPAFFGDSSTINDAYVYTVASNQAGPGSTNVGNLILGSTNGNIKMFVGNTAQANVIQTLANTGVYVTGVSSVSGNITGGNLTTTGTARLGNIVLTGNNINQLNANSVINLNGAQGNTDVAVYGQNNANAVFYVDASSNSASFGNATQTTGAIAAFNTNTSILLPTGNTSARPSGTTGMLRFNTTNNGLEIYDNAQWTPVGTTTFTLIADEQFNGDGSTVAFTLSSTQTTNSCIVSINGVVQIPTSAYSVTSTTLTFTEAPAAGDLIDVRELTTTTTVTSISNNSGNATVTANATAAQVDVLGNLLPSGNAVYTLGSATNYWKSLYVGGNTIFLGGLQLKSATGNVFNITTSDGTTPATLGNLTVGSGNLTVGNILNAGGNGTGNIGNSSSYFNTVFAKATSAQYADLAEKYVADAEYAPGTVVSFGGDKEVTKSEVDADRAVAGVVSTNPSYIMNATLEAEHVAIVAFTGRVPTSVTGSVAKGDLMVSNGDGTARAEADPKAGAIIGKALENFAGDTGVIEVVIGRF